MAGWTDYIADWSSADKLRLCSVYDALRTLTAAVNERSRAVDCTDIAMPSPLQSPLTVTAALHARIRAVMLLYVNHRYGNSGDFSGLDEIPMWTPEMMSAALDEALLDAPKTINELREWVFQQYRIINLLRWTKQRLSDDSMYIKELKKFYQGHYDSVSVTDWNMAVTKWSAQTWQSPSEESYIGYNGAVNLSEAIYITDSAYLAAIFVMRFVITFNVGDYPMDLYIYPGRTEASSFLPVGSAKFESKYNKIAAAQSALNFVMEWPGYEEIEAAITSAPSTILSEPSQQDAYDNKIYNLVNSGYGRTVVLKRDTPNGFKFRGEDW